MQTIHVPTDQEVAKILGRKLPPELLRMVPKDQSPEPLPSDMDKGWQRGVGLLFLPPI